MRSYDRHIQAVLRRPVEPGLHPTIRVMQQARPRAPAGHRVAPRRQRQLGRGLRVERPAHDAPREGVDQDRPMPTQRARQ
jgi:hypothetical protein